MNDREYFQTTSLSYQLQAARRELAGFRSGEAYQKLRADYEGIIREKNLTIKKLQKERDEISFSRRKITEQWMDVLEDVQKEHEKETEKLKKAIAELLDMVVSLKKRNCELDEKRKKALSDYYEAAVKLEEAQGLIVKLTAQVNHDYENSSMPSSKCIDRKKIVNNREKTGCPGRASPPSAQADGTGPCRGDSGGRKVQGQLKICPHREHHLQAGDRDLHRPGGHRIPHGGIL